MPVLGSDVAGPRPRQRDLAPATQEQLVRYTRVALVGLTVVLIGFSLLRTEESAWWNIMAWTLRNGATFAPVLAAFFWPVATRSGAMASLLGGFGAGLTWYALSGFSATEFFLGTHPVWAGMIVNMAALVTVSLATAPWRVSADHLRRTRGGASIVAALVLAGLTVANWGWAAQFGLTGLALFLVATAVFAAVPLLVVPSGSTSPEAVDLTEADDFTEADQANTAAEAAETNASDVTSSVHS